MRGIPDAEFKPEARGLTGHPAHWPRLLRVLQFAPLVFVIVALSGLGVPRALTKAEGGDAHQTVPGATPLAEAGRAISTGTKDEILPAVAYGVQSDEYLVVWEQEHALTDHQVIGQRLGGDGILRGDPILITPFGDLDSKPAVAYHPTADEYLVVYQRKCYDDIWVSTDLYGQRIAADGLLTGAPISISGLTIPDEAEPRVAAFTGSQGG
jgi:hypothetical protein